MLILSSLLAPMKKPNRKPIAHQVPPSMGFSRQEYWSGLPFPSPGALPNPGIKPGSPTLQADSVPTEPRGKPILVKKKKKKMLTWGQES